MSRSVAPKKGPKRVTLDYLSMCFDKRPLDPTDGFASLLGLLQTVTTAALAGDLPSRAELGGILQATVEENFLNQEFFELVGKWLMEQCSSSAQQENIRFTLREMGEMDWLPEHPVMAFLFRLWEPEWGNFVTELFIPGGLWFLPVEPSEDGPAYFDGLLSWWLLSSHVRVWHRSPEHFYRQLCQRALEDFNDDFPDVTLGSLMAADEILPELISEEAYRQYLYDPSETSWIEEAIAALEKRGYAVDSLKADFEEYREDSEEE
ncbi:hypothetical protein JST97_29195 [bacterium]|nr:hypothetical protein [bacterium]